MLNIKLESAFDCLSYKRPIGGANIELQNQYNYNMRSQGKLRHNVK